MSDGVELREGTVLAEGALSREGREVGTELVKDVAGEGTAERVSFGRDDEPAFVGFKASDGSD